MTLRLGYKASAEQFAPSELLGYGVLAEQLGFDSVFVSDHLQPWRHDGGHAPAALPWLGALAARTERVAARHQRAHPDLPLSPGGGRAGVRHARLPGARPGRPRRRLGRVAQRGAARARMAGRQGAVRPAQGGGHADQAAVDRGPGDLRRHLLPDREGHHLRQAGAAGADLHRRLRPGRDPARRPDRRRLHHHQRQGPTLYTEHAAAGRRRGRRQGRPLAGRPRPDDRDEGVLRPGPGAGARTTPTTGARWRCRRRRRPASRTRSRCSGGPTRCRSSGRRPAGSSRPTPTSTRRRSAEYLDMGFKHLVFHAPGPDQDRFLRLYGEEILPKLRALES